MSIPSVLAAYSDQLEWIPVTSSNLHSVAYQPDFRRLFVRFQKGGIVSAEWAYDDVPEVTYQAMMTAASKGSYFAANIRNVFAQQRVR